MTKKQVKIVKFILGKEEASGSNPDIGSTESQRVTPKLQKIKINLANYERTFACISLFLFPSILPRGTPIFALFWKSKQQKLIIIS